MFELAFRADFIQHGTTQRHMDLGPTQWNNTGLTIVLIAVTAQFISKIYLLEH